MKTALLIGATGLVGKQLLTQLLENKDIGIVKVFTRRPTGVEHLKLKEFITDFNEIEEKAIHLTGDILYTTLGTTLKVAGSKAAQYAIDFDMQFNTAKIACKNGVRALVVLSSAGANSKSSFFYARMKGELDDAVEKLSFKKVSIVRPSMLVGNRKEFRWSEKIFTPIMYAFSWFPGVRKYRPIKDLTVAKAMINTKKQSKRYQIYELGAVFELAKS